MDLTQPAGLESNLARVYAVSVAAYERTFARLDASMQALSELPPDVPEARATRRARRAILHDMARDMEETEHLTNAIHKASQALGKPPEAGAPRGEWSRATTGHLVRQKTEADVLEGVEVLSCLKGDVAKLVREGLRIGRHSLAMGWAVAATLRSLPAHEKGQKAAELEDIAEAVRVAARLLDLAQDLADSKGRVPKETRPLASCVSLSEVALSLGARLYGAFLRLVQVRARTVRGALYRAARGFSAAAWNFDALAADAVGKSVLGKQNRGPSPPTLPPVDPWAVN